MQSMIIKRMKLLYWEDIEQGHQIENKATFAAWTVSKRIEVQGLFSVTAKIKQQVHIKHTCVSSDPDIKSEPVEFQATVFTQPWCP